MPQPPGVRVSVASHFRRAFDKLPADLQRIAAQRLTRFATNPFDPRLRTHKLKGNLRHLWSFSVTEAHRVLVSFPKPGVAILQDIGTHDVYR